MSSIDMYDAASKIDEALDALSESEIKKAMLMALVAIGKADLLIDPDSIGFAKVGASPSPPVDDNQYLEQSEDAV